PIYFATTVDRNLYSSVANNLTLEGLTFRVTPGTPLSNGVNTDVAYDNVMNKFRWGGLETNPDIYLDVTSRNMVYTFRMYIAQIIGALIEEGKNDKALALLDKCVTVLPNEALAYGSD